MRILHCCLSNFYIDNYNYQENMLPIQNMRDGHTVRIIASTETFVDNVKYGYLQPSSYTTPEGIPIVRLPYSRLLPHFVMKKLRMYVGFERELAAFCPDVILFHGCSGWELLTVAKYKDKHPDVKLFADSHGDRNNSARKLISKIFLHKFFYRCIIRRAIHSIERVFYLWEEGKEFLLTYYKVPEEKLEFYPLGGIVYTLDEIKKKRMSIRTELGLDDDDILLCHSGKLNASKRTEDLLVALSHVQSDKCKLIITGSIPNEMRRVLEPLIEADKRVKFLGWKNGDELSAYLCACDMYVQPGSQSATMQNALCCGAAVMLYPHKSHLAYVKEYGMQGNCYFVESVEDIERALRDALANPDKLADMGMNSLKYAEERLDYRRLAARLCE